MSKFLKTLAVISALAIFGAGLISCSNGGDDDSTPTTTNTGFEGKYFNVHLINKLKVTADSENTIRYAQCSVAEVIFNSDGTGTYKILHKDYEAGEGRKASCISEKIVYTKSGSSLKFKLTDYGEMEFSILSEDNLYCITDGRLYDKYEINEIYAYLNITGMSEDDTSDKTVTSKAIILGKDGSAHMRNIESSFVSFARKPTIKTDDVPGTYEKSGSTFTFTEKNTNNKTTGTFSESNDGITYLTIGEKEYRKL